MTRRRRNRLSQQGQVLQPLDDESVDELEEAADDEDNDSSELDSSM